MGYRPPGIIRYRAPKNRCHVELGTHRTTPVPKSQEIWGSFVGTFWFSAFRSTYTSGKRISWFDGSTNDVESLHPIYRHRACIIYYIYELNCISPYMYILSAIFLVYDVSNPKSQSRRHSLPLIYTFSIQQAVRRFDNHPCHMHGRKDKLYLIDSDVTCRHAALECKF